MVSLKRLKVFLVLIFMFTPLFSFGRFKFLIDRFFHYLKDTRRYEIAGNYMWANGTFNGVTPFYGYNNIYLGDSTLKRKTLSNPGYGGTIGTTIPIAATGHISLFAFSINLMGNMYSWSDVNRVYQVDGVYKQALTPVDATTLQISMPLGIDWKVGSDAICSKRIIMGYGIGGGIMPNYNMSTATKLSGLSSQATFGVIPYVKSELAFALGICFKVRAMYSWGDVELLNVQKKYPGFTDGPFKITNNSNLQFSLIIMPFSKRWRESAWYNDYDSYNWNEGLN